MAIQAHQAALTHPPHAIKTALIGGGQGCRAILELIKEGRLSALSLDVVGVVDPNPESAGSVYARSIGIPTFSSVDKVLGFPGLELIIELTGSDEILADLYRLMRPGIRIMDHSLARVFWDLNDSVQRFQRFLDSAHDLITMKDLEGRYLFINPVAAELFKRRPEDFIGKTDRDLFSPSVAALFARKDREVLDNLAHICHEETLTIQGKRYHLNTVRFPLLDYKGDCRGVCSISRDMTAQKDLQRGLIQSEKLAALGKLAAGVAHEINNPLSGILAFVEELLLDVDPNDPVRRDYEVIRREALRCRRIVRDLLDFARLHRPVRERMDLNGIVRRVLNLVAKQAAFRNIAFDLRLSPSVREVNVDAGQMQQVILNLVMNASDAMDGAGTITIATGYNEHPQEVFLTVSDHGCGIPEEDLPKIFEPFFSTKGPRGNGLGLPVIQSIVEQHAGTIAVTTEVGKGTTFKISLPAAADQCERGAP
jgi:two-component system NtrC family sensor kinase